MKSQSKWRSSVADGQMRLIRLKRSWRLPRLSLLSLPIALHQCNEPRKVCRQSCEESEGPRDPGLDTWIAP